MRKENRMLLLFALGMMALLTVLRVLYPNIGLRDESFQLPAQELRVACEEPLLGAVREFVRSYEAGYSVQVDLSPLGDAAGGDCDVSVAREEWPGPPALEEFDLPWSRSRGPAAKARVHSRSRDAARFARLLSQFSPGTN